MKKRWILASLGLLGMTTAEAGIFHRHTRAPLLPGIPTLDYQSTDRSPSKEAFSTVGILLENRTPLIMGEPLKPGDTPRRPRMRVFQLAEATLQLDHCFVSRVAVTLHESGCWSVSARADQNPVKLGTASDPGAFRPDRPRDLFTEHLKRNQFFLKIRCQTLGTVATKLPNTAPGPATLIRLEPAPFWVQNGQPYDYHTEGCDPRIGAFFELWDRVEVEFYYR
jgi:hypothetical protein